MKWLPPAGPQRRRQVIRLGVLLVLLGGLVWYQMRGTSPAVPARANANQAAVPVDQLAVPEPVDLNALASVTPPTDAARNPFAFGVPPPPPPPPQPVLPDRPVEQMRPPEPVGPPPIRLRLTGLTVLPGSQRALVTLTDPNTHALYQGFEGDIVDGRYRIVKIGLQSVVVSYVDGSGMRTLALGG